MVSSILDMLLTLLRIPCDHGDKRRTKGEFLQRLLLIMAIGLIVALILAVWGLIESLRVILSS